MKTLFSTVCDFVPREVFLSPFLFSFHCACLSLFTCSIPSFCPQMVELIDAPQATSLPLKSKTATRRVAHEASKENSEDKKKQEEKEEVDGATSFVSRLKAFYAK